MSIMLDSLLLRNIFSVIYYLFFSKSFHGQSKPFFVPIGDYNWVIPCEKSEKNMTNFFWFLTWKVKIIRYFSDKNNFFEKNCWFLTIFWFFLRKSQLFWKLQKWEFTNNVFFKFFYCLKVSYWNQRSKILQIFISYSFQRFPVLLFYKTYF